MKPTTSTEWAKRFGHTFDNPVKNAPFIANPCPVLLESISLSLLRI